MTSRSEVEIRPFRRRDLARVREIEDASFPRDPYPNEFFLDLFENCGRLFFIAKHSGRIAGYVVTCTGKRDAEIVSIAVDPLHRGAGVGKALMRHTLAIVKRAGIERVLLMVRVKNAAAIGFYGGFGFRRTGRVSGYYGRGGDALRMQKKL